MSVQPGPTFKRYAANGVATVYAIPFLLLNAADLQVTLNGVLVTTGFTLAGIGNPQSSCTFSTPPSGDLLFQMVVPFQRLADYQINGDLLAQTINPDFDRLWLAVKQLNRDSSRALTVSLLEPEGIPPLPTKAARALRMLAFDADGNPTTSSLTLAQLEQQPALALAAAQASADSAVASGVSAASALASAVNSSDSATLSQMWASNPEDTPVVAGLYSAFHWARKALASAQAAAATLAGAVMKTGAQTMAGPLTVTNGFVGIPLSKEYSSPEQVITPAGGQVLPHGLPSIPRLLISNLICKTAELGYTAGEIVGVSSNPDYAYSLGVSVVPDASNVMYRYGSQAGVFFILHKVTGSVSLITPANWRLVIRAWA